MLMTRGVPKGIQTPVTGFSPGAREIEAGLPHGKEGADRADDLFDFVVAQLREDGQG